jgi:hypothetical protein
VGSGTQRMSRTLVFLKPYRVDPFLYVWNDGAALSPCHAGPASCCPVPLTIYCQESDAPGGRPPRKMHRPAIVRRPAILSLHPDTAIVSPFVLFLLIHSLGLQSRLVCSSSFPRWMRPTHTRSNPHGPEAAIAPNYRSEFTGDKDLPAGSPERGLGQKIDLNEDLARRSRSLTGLIANDQWHGNGCGLTASVLEMWRPRRCVSLV